MKLSLEELETLEAFIEKQAMRGPASLDWTEAEAAIYIKICEEIKERRSRLIEK